MNVSVSFAVHTFNEADALRRLVVSSLPMAAFIQEWVIVDHRSTDHTTQVIDGLRPMLAQKGIPLTTFREERDLSAAFTFADIRNMTIKACAHPIVVLHDADFILGPHFRGFLSTSKERLAMDGSTYFGAAYSIPCVWDRLKTGPDGTITHHGRIWVHQIRPRILWKDALHFAQIGDGGRWEKLVLDDPLRKDQLNLTANRKGPMTRDAIVSCNVKSAERIALRDTMTMFMQDAVQGKLTGDWLQNYETGQARKQDAYPYQKRSVRGWRLHLPNLDLAA